MDYQDTNLSKMEQVDLTPRQLFYFFFAAFTGFFAFVFLTILNIKICFIALLIVFYEGKYLILFMPYVKNPKQQRNCRKKIPYGVCVLLLFLVFKK
jgi:hypothetical protein